MSEQEDYADPAQPVSRRWVNAGVGALLLGVILACCWLTGGCRLGPAPSTLKGQPPAR